MTAGKKEGVLGEGIFARRPSALFGFKNHQRTREKHRPELYFGQKRAFHFYWPVVLYHNIQTLNILDLNILYIHAKNNTDKRI